MSLFSPVRPSFKRAAPTPRPKALERPPLPPFEAEIDFAPRDQRSGYVAGLALRKSGVQLLVERGYDTKTATQVVHEAADKVEEMGRDAAFTYGIKRTPKERPTDKVLDQHRKPLAAYAGFEAGVLPPETDEAAYQRWAEKKALAGEEAALILRSLDIFAYEETGSYVNPFDKATAQIMLSDVDPANPHIRI